MTRQIPSPKRSRRPGRGGRLNIQNVPVGIGDEGDETGSTDGSNDDAPAAEPSVAPSTAPDRADGPRVVEVGPGDAPAEKTEASGSDVIAAIRAAERAATAAEALADLERFERSHRLQERFAERLEKALAEFRGYVEAGSVRSGDDWVTPAERAARRESARTPRGPRPGVAGRRGLRRRERSVPAGQRRGSGRDRSGLHRGAGLFDRQFRHRLAGGDEATGDQRGPRAFRDSAGPAGGEPVGP